MIRTVLIDDEIDSIRVLQRLLEAYCPNVNVVGKADGVETGIHTIQTARPDLVFLDIEMTQGNAFDLLNRLQPINFQIIFVTAFDNYAIRAFKYSAVDYLLKPVREERFDAAVRRLKQKLSGGGEVVQFEREDRMCLRTPTETVIVQLGKLIALRADGDYTWVELEDRKPIYWCRRLGELAELLPVEMFLRLDRKLVVQRAKVLNLEHKSRDEGWLHLAGRHEPLIIRRRALARLSQSLAGQ